MSLKIVHVVGNRPQFVKLSPILRAAATKPSIENVIVHSGQHYDYEMSKIFFDDLKLPEPNYHLDAGSGTHGVQTGRILERLDPILLKERPAAILVYGDTNTTLAGALAGYKLHIPVGHVEAGMREGIWRPEEMNKKMADHCSDYCFCPIERAAANLKREGIDDNRIYNTGDITYDAFLNAREILKGKELIPVPDGDFYLLTLHRAETVDDGTRLRSVFTALLDLDDARIVFPVHPRTRKILNESGLQKEISLKKNITLMKPLGYYDFLNFLTNSKMVLTDSSGVLKEAFYAERPCVTLDETTEYREIFEMGFNILAGFESAPIKSAVEKMLSIPPFSVSQGKNPFGDGRAAYHILNAISNLD